MQGWQLPRYVYHVERCVPTATPGGSGATRAGTRAGRVPRLSPDAGELASVRFTRGEIALEELAVSADAVAVALDPEMAARRAPRHGHELPRDKNQLSQVERTEEPSRTRGRACATLHSDNLCSGAGDASTPRR